MNCTNCDIKRVKGIRFCPNCGASLEGPFGSRVRKSSSLGTTLLMLAVISISIAFLTTLSGHVIAKDAAEQQAAITLFEMERVKDFVILGAGVISGVAGLVIRRKNNI